MTCPLANDNKAALSISKGFLHCCCLSLAHMIVLHALRPIPNHPRPYHNFFLALPSFVGKNFQKVKRIADRRLGLVPFSESCFCPSFSSKVVSFRPIFHPSRRMVSLFRSAKLFALRLFEALSNLDRFHFLKALSSESGGPVQLNPTVCLTLSH
jgi:hypothetical protein